MIQKARNIGHLSILLGLSLLMSCAQFDLGTGETLRPQDDRSQTSNDQDLDGIADADDNCPDIYNPDQTNVCEGLNIASARLTEVLVEGNLIALRWEDENNTVDEYELFHKLIGASGSNGSNDFISEGIQLPGDTREAVFTAVPGLSYEFKIRSYKGGDFVDSNTLTAIAGESNGNSNILPEAPIVGALSNDVCELIFSFEDRANNEGYYQVQLQYEYWYYDDMPWDPNDPGTWEPGQVPASKFYSFDAGDFERIETNALRAKRKLNDLERDYEPNADRPDEVEGPDLEDFRFRVRAVNNFGNSEYSAWSNTVNLPSPCFDRN